MTLVVALTPSADRGARAAEYVPRPSAQDDGLRTDMRTSYRLDPVGGAVHVTVLIVVRNEQPDVVEGAAVRRSFLDSFGVSVLAEAEAFSASRAGDSLPVLRRSRPGTPLATASIDLEPDLFFGETQEIRLTYRIPALPPRDPGFSRVNAAFVTFPIFTGGDPGSADIEVIVPRGFEVEVVGDPLERVDAGAELRYRAERIPDPGSFLTSVVARDDDALVAVPVTFGQHELTVLGWPDDEEWARFVADTVRRGVPVLEELVGLPWPGTDELEVIETASPYLYGYAGWYLPSRSLVEVGDELDGRVILHELSHLWFNQRLFAERWINEGLAEVFAVRALAQLGDPLVPPSPPSPMDPARIDLLDWSDPDLAEPISDGQERYGYAAARSVIEGIISEIGVDALSDVIKAAASRELAYSGGGEPLRYPDAIGWQAFLDLVEVVGGAAGAEELFTALVLPEPLHEQLAERRSARIEYRRLVEAGADWAPPAGVRRAMSAWQFDLAGDLVAAAEEVLVVRSEVVRSLRGVGIDTPGAFEAAYEVAESEDDLTAAASGVVPAAREVVAAVRAKRAASGPLVAVGLLGGGAARSLAEARTELDAGDYRAAQRAARSAASAYDDADRVGAQRLAAMVLLLVALGLWGRRRRSDRSGDGSIGDEPSPEVL